MRAHGFDAASGSQLTLPGDRGTLAGAVLGVGDALDPFSYAHAPRSLPAGHWEISGELDDDARRALQLGWRSEEHTSELQSLMRSSYAVFCLKKKTNRKH